MLNLQNKLSFNALSLTLYIFLEITQCALNTGWLTLNLFQYLVYLFHLMWILLHISLCLILYLNLIQLFIREPFLLYKCLRGSQIASKPLLRIKWRMGQWFRYLWLMTLTHILMYIDIIITIIIDIVWVYVIEYFIVVLGRDYVRLDDFGVGHILLLSLYFEAFILVCIVLVNKNVVVVVF